LLLLPVSVPLLFAVLVQFVVVRFGGRILAGLPVVFAREGNALGLGSR